MSSWDLGTRAVWSVCLGLLLCAGAVSAADNDRAPEQTQPATVGQPSNTGSASGRVSHHVAGSDSEDCDCMRCRLTRCSLVRQISIYKDDKRLFHRYIRGEGPAIHTRPAGFYWW